MRTEVFGKNIFCGSKEFYEEAHPEELENLETYVNKIIRIFTRRRLFQELLTAHAARTGLEGYTVLEAHGTRSKPWRFGDGERRLSMQGWIDRHDGYALALFIYACNSSNQEIHSRQSIVIHAPCTIVDWNFDKKKIPSRIYVPGEGYLENNHYKLRRIIDEAA